MTEWIDVNERTPEPLPDVYYSRDVIFITDKGVMYIGVYLKSFDKWEENTSSCLCCWEPPNVWYWAELPEGPK